MDLGFFICGWRWFTRGVAWLSFSFLIWPAAAADSARPSTPDNIATNEFDLVGKAVLQLLQDHDAGQFATNLVVANNDWLSLVSTNSSPDLKEELENYAKGNQFNRDRLETAAEVLLKRAEVLHLDFSQGDWRFRVVAPRQVGKILFSHSKDEKPDVPYVERLEITLGTNTTSSPGTEGDFRLMASALEKFPGGWRIAYPNVVQWVSFPANVVDEKTARELVLLGKAANDEGFSGNDDPALLKLGDALIDFIREQSVEVFKKEALFTPDQLWSQFQKLNHQGGPSRQEFDTEINPQLAEENKEAGTIVQQMKDSAIDLRNADIQVQKVSIERSRSQGEVGSLDGLTGTGFKLDFSVKTDARAKAGAPLAGNYTLGVKEIWRIGDDWKVMQNVHWVRFPDGVVDTNTAATINFDNYVAERGTLPPGTLAPEIAFTPLAGGNPIHLSELRGKVVVLDFWATWCGPCQQPMADLQTLRQNHPDWQDQVIIVPLSIDDTMDIVRDHVNKRGWTNTFNVWAGDGGWHSAPAVTFRVRMVPTTYIIDAAGKIVNAGHPAGLPIAETIDHLLKP